MKQRIRVVVVENEKLHSDLKSKTVDESLRDYTIQNTMVMFICVFKSHIKNSFLMKYELRLGDMH